MTNDETIALRGQAVYDRDLRDKLEPAFKGKFVAIDVDTGDYAIGDRALHAIDELRVRRPDSIFFIARVGYRTAYRLGARSMIRDNSP